MAGYELRVRADFFASHQIRLLDGEMEPLHEHNWRVDVFVEGRQLGDHGMLMDFTDLKHRLAAITDALSHSCLNEHPAFANGCPTTERLAKFFHDALSPGLTEPIAITKVRVYETPDCAAAYLSGPR